MVGEERERKKREERERKRKDKVGKRQQYYCRVYINGISCLE